MRGQWHWSNTSMKSARSVRKRRLNDFYNVHMCRTLTGWLSALLITTSPFVTGPAAQTPQPFPGAGARAANPPAPPAQPAPAAPLPPRAAAQAGEPSAATLVFPLYPTAQFVTSYDAGRGQRYYIYGTTAAFADVVIYYRTQLKERGNLVYDTPPTHMFEVGRFQEDTMAFPPSVTVKDWTFGGSQGYPNPRRGTQPARFPTILMFVPPPSPASAAPGR